MLAKKKSTSFTFKNV